MSSSHLDDLLGEFGETTMTTHKTSSHGVFDDFDPFEQSYESVHSSHVTNTELLLDFSTDGGENHNGETGGGLSHLSDSSSNPFYDMSTDTKSSNQFYDFNSGSSNPLYEMSSAETTHEPSNPLYEFSSETTTTTDWPSNLLYDKFGSGDADYETHHGVDLLSGTDEHHDEDDDHLQNTHHHHYISSSFNQEEEEEEEERQLSSLGDEPLVLNGEARHWVGEPYEVEQQHHHHEQYEDNTYSQHVGVLEEEEHVVEDGRNIIRTTRTETRHYGHGVDDDAPKTENFSSNHWDEDGRHEKDEYDTHRGGQDIIHFSEMSARKQKLESESTPKPAPRKSIDIQREIVSSEGGVYESNPQSFHQWQNEVEQEEGVFESQPARRDDVVREADSDKTADLPPVGTAQSLRAKFMSAQHETPTKHKREASPTFGNAANEHVSQPRAYIEKYEGRAESGVFESEPVHNPDVVRSGEELKEELPERGMAKNLANMFRQISSETSSHSSVGIRAKRDITPERSKHAEYASETQGNHLHDYDVKVDAGVFENQPHRAADVVTSDSVAEEYIPEPGFAKNVAAKFRVLESTVKSPPQSPIRKRDFTPPREEDKSHHEVYLDITPDIKSDIVHSTDHQEEALPERGTAKNMALLFRQMEAENKSPSSPKAKKVVTPPLKESGVVENHPKQFHADYNAPAESGISENHPIRRDDVTRGDEPPRYEEELPERGAAKNLVNKWRQMESEVAKLKSPGSSGRPKDFSTPKEESRTSQYKKSPRTPLSPSGHGRLDNGSVHPSDLPGQYQPQIEASVFESSPHERSDVVREGDADLTDGMPKKDTAKKMLARFQSIQAEASKQTSSPVLRKETETRSKTIRKVGRSKSMRAAIQTEKCGACEKTVYAMERLEMNKTVYHKACFRCTQCKAVLTPKTFAINNNIIFCTTHYKQLFATKGNYDEGFGRIQHKKRWSSNPNLAKDDEEEEVKS